MDVEENSIAKDKRIIGQRNRVFARCDVLCSCLLRKAGVTSIGAAAIAVMAADTFPRMALLPRGPNGLPGNMSLPLQKTAGLRTRRDIRRLPTFTRTINGSDTIPAATTSTTTSITHGNTDASLAALAVAMSSGWLEETGSVSGLVVSTSALPRTTTTSAMTGSGIVTTL
jgi:hypothetical protein